jgi:hypothetical protein
LKLLFFVDYSAYSEIATSSWSSGGQPNAFW